MYELAKESTLNVRQVSYEAGIVYVNLTEIDANIIVHEDLKILVTPAVHGKSYSDCSILERSSV